jgi:hypothetical protein
VYGALAAAWPLIRRDLGLSYAEIGLLLALPGLVGSALDPLVGALGDSPRRRATLICGGLGFAVAAAGIAFSVDFWMLLVALLLANPASGAFVSLSQAADLLVDVFFGFLALYLVDVAGARPAEAALSLAVWTGAGLAGDALLLLVLRHVSGRRSLRWSASAAFVLYPAFLVVPHGILKLALLAALGLLNSGWYAIPKAGLYEALPGRSGSVVALGGIGGLAGAVVPLGLGLLAGAVGLAATMWFLLLAPVAVLALVPRSR